MALRTFEVWGLAFRSIATIMRLFSTIIALALIACTTSASRGAIIDVYVYSFDFSVNPNGQPIVDAVITVGDTVRWVWQEGNHTTTSVEGIPEQWDAPITSGSPNFSHTFTNVGTWHYYCIPHGFDNGDQTAGGMSGTVTVLSAGPGACCLPGGTCAVVSPASCLSQGGTYQGDGTGCTPNPCGNQPVTVSLPIVQDAILYQSAAGNVANGAGQHLYTGNQAGSLKRRIVIKFTLAGIPAGATIQDVDLKLYCNQSSGAAVNMPLHRLNADWGEGTSDDTGNESDGTTATINDATWLHRFYDTQFWNAPGGDFQPTPSASLSVGTAGAFHIWSSLGMAADMQAWVNNPASNFGWILLGDELTDVNTKRFDSRQSAIPANWPQLTITYLPPGSPGACCLPDGSCVEVVQGLCSSRGGTWSGANSTCANTSCPVVLTPYLDPLPIPAIAQPTTGTIGGAAHYDIAVTEFMQQLHANLPPTRCFGYGGSYPGPTIVARTGLPVTVTWTNNIRVFETQQFRTVHPLTIHTCMHGPDMTGLTPVIVTHLHGGHVAPASDGYPELAFPPGQSSPLYTYPNNQPAGTVWYHDHALGITRLNVMMGMAGFYLIRDSNEDALNIPGGEYEIGLAIQDRSFNADGSFQYPEMMMDHFFGDTILVNGKVWPYVNVKQGKYRFRMLNGSNSRVYRLSLSNGATFWQIGTDLGLMNAPIALTQLTIAPGERADVIVDFAPYAAGTEIILANDAPILFPGTPGNGVIPNVMKFIVQNAAGDTDAIPSSLVAVPPIPVSTAKRQRTIELTLGADPMCNSPHGMWTLNGLMWDDITELPRLDSTEIWAWKNRSAVTHPMHMHLVSFQVLDRQAFDTVTGLPTGPLVPPAANEIGWKDTVQAPPGVITRVIARFQDFEGLFPYHCHILEHEDHEMMRQFEVRPACAADIAPAGNVDDAVGVADLLMVISAWGACGDCNACPADIAPAAPAKHDCSVNVADLLSVITHWGACR